MLNRLGIGRRLAFAFGLITLIMVFAVATATLAFRSLRGSLEEVSRQNAQITLTKDAQARWYAGTGEPMDKAGAYAVQGIAALFIDRIEGSFATVMGFPVERFGELAGRLGLLGTWLGMP